SDALGVCGKYFSVGDAMSFGSLRRILVAVIFSLAGMSVAYGQQFSGLTGGGTDNSGGAGSGAKGELGNTSRALHFTTTTNDIGVYQFSRIPPATGYELTFRKDGFRKALVSNVSLGVGTVETRDVRLEVGDLAQSVEVFLTGEASLNTTDASI